MNLQGLIVIALVVAAALFLGRNVLRSMSSRGTSSGCHGCDLCPPGRQACLPDSPARGPQAPAMPERNT